MIVPPLPQCSGAFKMEFREDGKRIEGDWPIYFHTLLPYRKNEDFKERHFDVEEGEWYDI